MVCFQNFLGVFGREGGLTAFWVLTPADDAAKAGTGGGGAWAARKWVAPEDAYEVSAGEDPHFALHAAACPQHLARL